MLDAIVWLRSVPCDVASPCLHTEFGCPKWSRRAVPIASRTAAESPVALAARRPSVRRGRRQSELTENGRYVAAICSGMNAMKWFV